MPTTKLFTMHGTIMLLLFRRPVRHRVWPTTSCPLQIGARHGASRLNALGYWLFTLFAGIVMLGGFAHRRRRGCSSGGTGYSPLSERRALARRGRRPVDRGHRCSAPSGVLTTGVNVVATVICMRAPGMTAIRN